MKAEDQKLVIAEAPESPERFEALIPGDFFLSAKELWRKIGSRAHYDCQMVNAISMHDGSFGLFYPDAQVYPRHVTITHRHPKGVLRCEPMRAVGSTDRLIKL